MGALRRLGVPNLWRARAPWLAAGATFLVLAPVLLALRPVPRHVAPPAVAVAIARRDPMAGSILHRAHWTSVKTKAFDAQLESVEFFDGPQIVVQVLLDRRGHVDRGYLFTGRQAPYGNWIAYQPLVLVGLALLFFGVTAVLPWRRWRNLEVLAVLSLTAPAVLMQHRYVTASVLSALPGLLLLLARGVSTGLGRTDPATAAGGTPLLEVLARRVGRDPVRTSLRAMLVALALVFLMVGVSSPAPVDVLYAVMEGATKLIHGVLPYGHLPGDVLHGDTYPILSYAAYVPLALLSPVASDWDTVDLALGVTAATAVGAAALAWWHGRGRSPARDDFSGLRAALALLAFPPLLVAVSSGTSDVVLAALLMLALVLWRRPAAASTVLASAAWFKLVPAALLPVWLAPLRGRRLLAAGAGLAAVSLASVGLVVALGGLGGLRAMAHAISYQTSRGSSQSMSEALGLGALQPLAEAAGAALVVGAAVRMRALGSPGPERLAAISVAILVAAQLAASYWAFLYLTWIMPPLALSLTAAAAPSPARQARRETVRLAPRPAAA